MTATTDLYPTRTRLALLDDVHMRRVISYPSPTTNKPRTVKLILPGQKPRLVTRDATEAEHAGWIRLADTTRPTGGIEYQLTELGEALRTAGRAADLYRPTTP